MLWGYLECISSQIIEQKQTLLLLLHGLKYEPCRSIHKHLNDLQGLISIFSNQPDIIVPLKILRYGVN